MKPNTKVFQIIDLDRTLLDTAKLAHYLKEIVARHDQKLSENINNEIIKHLAQRKSFFLFEYIAKQVGDEEFKKYIDELHVIAPTIELLLPGAKERIAYAKSQPGWGMGIMTYGSKRDQMIKLKLIDLHLEHLMIVNSPYKGELIASWKLPDGTFKLPIEFGGHIVDIVTLDDDKLIAFEGLPEGAYGQWIAHASLGGSTELQNFSEHIRVVPNLEMSVHYLKTKL
ncbi:MAG: hypothetical protein V4611_03240 [Patescibacteria group bacterium]